MLDEYPFQILKHYPRAELDRVYESFEKNNLAALRELYSLLTEMYPKLKKNKKSRAYDSIQPAISYIEQHCTEKIYIDFLAKLCNLSPSRFFNVFKSLTGNTPIGYKNAMRIQKGVELLYETDLSVEEISEKLAFSSPAHFRQQFKSVTGITPKQIRK